MNRRSVSGKGKSLSFFSKVSIPALGRTQPSVQWIPRLIPVK